MASDLKQRVLAAALAVAAGGTITLGSVGSTLIQDSEGYRPRAYRDPVGIITACYGHTDPNLRLSMTFTRDECDLLFTSDVIKHQVVIRPGHMRNCIGNVWLTPNQTDAVTSLIFNIGTGNFCGSSLARKLKAKDFKGAALEFPKWKYADHKVLPGLVIRRAKEQELFRSTATWVSWDMKELVVIGSATASDKP